MREIRFDYINWYTIIRDLLRRFWVIVLAAVTGFIGVRTYFDFTYKPVYQCSATIAVSAVDSGIYSFSSLNKTIETAATFQEMFQSSYFREKLIEMTGYDVDGEISASQINETNLIVIKYSCDEPLDAYKTLIAIIENYNEITDYGFHNMILTIISPPHVPTVPSNPVSYGYFDKIGSAFMALLVIFFIVVSSYFRDTVKNETDVNNMLDAKLFSVIYHEEKNKTIRSKLRFTHSKAPLLITDILINYRFAESFRVAALKLEYLINSKKIKTMMITSCGENEGKTTAAVNLALAIAKLGRKTLLIDADLRKPAIHHFFKNDEIDNPLGLGEVLSGNVSITNSIIRDPKTGLYIMCGAQKYSNSSEMLSTRRFEHFVESLKEQFDIIIFDTAPTALVSDAEIISGAIDSAIVVVRQDVAPVPEINDMIDMLNQSDVSVEGCIFNDVKVLPKFSSHVNTVQDDKTADPEVNY